MSAPRTLSLPRAGAVRGGSFETAAGLACVALVVAAAIGFEAFGLWRIALAVGVAATAAFFLLCRRLELTLLVLALYLGLLDGFAKLGTGAPAATLGRDLLLYAIVAGALTRVVVARRRLELPPLTRWVALFTLVVCVQLLNPANMSIANSLGGLRPHLEFVPLFFLGYAVLDTPRRLRALLILLVVCGVANGVAGLLQLNLTPAQFADWGPGYRNLVYGDGLLTTRLYWVDDVAGPGDGLVRPFGLGSDTGVGGLVGVCAVGAALALVGGVRGSRLRALAIAGAGGVALAVFTSQSRGVLVAAVIAAIAYLVYTVSPQRLLRTLVTAVLAVGVTLAVVSVVAGHSGEFLFARYDSILPSRLLSTAAADRGQSLAVIPDLLRDHPLGGGIASVGPASTFAGGAQELLNGETLFTFYLSSLGIPGLLVVLWLYLTLVVRAGRRVRRVADPGLRTSLAALLAPIAGLLSTSFAGGALVAPPTAPFFWLTLGIAARWLFRPA
jgi:hypothetical protein